MIDSLAGKRVALAHHWLISMRGGEKVLAAMAEMIPDAPIFTLVANRDALGPSLRTREIHTSFLQRLPGATRAHRRFLPLYPLAAESLDARAFDVIICSDASVAKGIRTRSDALKICYCHSPMRYVWDLYEDYRSRAGLFGKLALTTTAGRLRKWDRNAAQTVTAFVANSHHVAGRIARHYGRKAVTIYPPVEQLGVWESEPEDFYLVLGEHVEYKRTDLAVEACQKLGRKLVVIGDGPMLSKLRQRESDSIRFLGWQDDAVAYDYLSRCRALLFCGQEDFGMVPVEAQSMGRPVLAFNAGGATETVVHGRTGWLFDDQTVDAVVDAIVAFENQCDAFQPGTLLEHAARFSPDVFREDFMDFVTWCVERWECGGPAAVRDHLDSAIETVVPWADFCHRDTETGKAKAEPA